MKWTLLLLVAAGMLLFTLSPRVSAAEAVRLSLKLNGTAVAGENTKTSLDTTADTTIECLSYDQLITAPSGTGAGAAAKGTSDQQPIVIRKRMDKTSPVLLKALQDKTVAEGVFKFYRPSPLKADMTEQFYTVTFKEGHISSIRQIMPSTVDPSTAKEPLQEEVTFTSNSITYDYHFSDAAATPGATVPGYTATPQGTPTTPVTGTVPGGQNVVGGATPGAVALGPLGAPITPGTGTVPGGQNVVGGPNAAEIALAPLGPPITTGMGTTPGGQSVLGVTYAMGAGGMALNLTVRSAEYTPGHVIAKPGSVWAANDEKLLVVHYTLGNPTAAAMTVGRISIDWTATNADGITRPQGDVIVEGTGQALNQNLLPAQSVNCYAIFPVPAAGPVTTLLAHLDGDNVSPDATFNMTGQITPLPAPYADPTDPTGATIVAAVPGVIGGSYVLGPYNVKVVSVEKADTVMATKPDAGNTFLVVTLAYTNASDATFPLLPATELRDADGTVYHDNFGVLSTTATRTVGLMPKTEDTANFSLAYQVPTAVAMKTLTLINPGDRTVVIDLTARQGG